MHDRKIILFELNEVPFRIIDAYCHWQPDSYLARYLPSCHQYITFTDDSTLSPWVTWPTLHRGVTDRQHAILHFGQDLANVNQAFPPLWQISASQGIKTGLFGPLHTYPIPQRLDNYCFYVPDTFAAGSECFPERLSTFQAFNLTMARHSARNVSATVPWKAALHFLLNCANLGVKLDTLVDITQQLMAETVEPWRRTRRRTYQSILAFDLFWKQLKTTRPSLAIFFTNHVAAFMHRYWAAAFPDDYETLEYDRDWLHRYGCEIQFAMKKFDCFFAHLVQFVDRHPDYTLWITSSMGQAATTAKPVKTQLYLTNVAKFMQRLDIPMDSWHQCPAMQPDISIFVSENWVAPFRASLENLNIDRGSVQFDQQNQGFFSLFFGHKNLPESASFATLNGRNIPFPELGLENVRIDDSANTNAYHIPDGSLIIYDPKNRPENVERKRISTLEISPTILKNFAIEIPNYMQKPVFLN